MTALPLLDVPSFEPEPDRRIGGVGGVGDPGTWLLSGPSTGAGAESLEHHQWRHGRHDPWARPDGLRALLRESRLQGRGGGGFPMSRKLDTAILAPGEPRVIVNGSESEPASHKDRTLITLRPHLVLDGAAAVAGIVGTHEVVVHLHRSSAAAAEALAVAIAERRAAGVPDPRWRVSTGPDRYVAGEASAVASLVNGGEARPHFSDVPMAERGPSGRPTVVNNAETVAQLGLLTRMGWAAWQAGGSPSLPGPHLFTLVGAVGSPGEVVEMVGPGTIGDLLVHGGLRRPPPAVLIGGYAGTWVDGPVAWTTALERPDLEQVGAGLGCGLLAVLPEAGCGLVETARLVGYLAGETAGQCGPCVHGLPRLSRAFWSLAHGSLRRRGLRRLLDLAEMTDGSGACRHPDGVVRLIRSALGVFAHDVQYHLAHGPCPGVNRPAVLPVPDPASHHWGWR